MFGDEEVIDASTFDFGESETYDYEKELKASEDEILAELGKVDTGNREEVPPVLQKVFDMRDLDHYYMYLAQYKSGDFLKKKTSQILKYQVFNEYTQFYKDDSNIWSNKIRTGLAEDILDMFVEKVLTTNLRIYEGGSESEIKSELINPIALKVIVKGLAKYERCLVIAKDIGVKEEYTIEGDEIIGRTESSTILNRVKVYPPHMYDMDDKVIVTKKSNGGIETESFADEKYTELFGESLLSKKSELIYLASLFVTNFGIEGETGKMKIHVDERYGEGLSKDVYTIYDAIQSGGVKDFTPLWQTTQGQIRPNDWKTSLETILYLISRSVGIDIRGTVYSTATQADISNLDNVIKINAKLRELEYALNKVMQDILGINGRAKFDTFSHDNIDQKLSRLENAYTMGGLLVKDYMERMYEILNLDKPTEKDIVQLKVEKNIPLTKAEIALGVDASDYGMEGE